MTSLEPFFGGLISFGYFLVVLGLAVIIHEWGHFIVAKLCGAKVERFAVGFGKSLFTYTWHGTEYALCALPLGGYVKITGMDPEDELTGADWEYLQLSPWKRMAIVVAGPLMNFVLAFILYVFILGWFGEAYTATTTVGHVPKGSWGWELGLRDGDNILAVNERPVTSWDEVSAYQRNSDSTRLSVKIERDGQQMTKAKDIPPGFWDALQDVEAPEFEQGILVTRILPNTPAEKSGLKSGWVVTEVDGQTFGALDQWTDYLSQRLEKTESGEYVSNPIALKAIDSQGEEHQIEVTPDVLLPAEDALPFEPVARIGAVFQGEISLEDYLTPSTGLIGVAPKLPPVIGTAQEGSPAAKSGLDSGARIVEINGEAIDDWTDVLLTIQNSLQTEEDGTVTAKPLDITWLTADETMRTEAITPTVRKTPILTPSSIKTGKEYNIAQIGVDLKHDRRRLGVVGAVSEGWNRTVGVSTMILDFIGKLFTGGVSPKLMGGPIAIFQMSGESGRWGLEKFLGFIAMLSANLGILNLFPMPPFDGGHIMFYLYEVVRRKPITLRQMENFGKIGFILVMPLLLFLVFNDLSRINFFSWIAGLLGLS
ncbi:MAG: RIP metalloprotease RseP [Candidatus Hinthialibacter antarcticus]|nr:RIP metalloprotease RseP [Candidatus Hinthialibacter antarcticus]